MKSLFTMEINKITVNGVEYALSDKEAQQIAAVLSQRVSTVETATEKLNSDVIELRKQQEQLRGDITNPSLYWNVIRDDGTIAIE